MIVDARKLEANAILEADIAIVGAGAAGITLARVLANRSEKMNILLIEGGGERYDFKDQSKYFSGDEEHHPHHPPLDLYRRRMLGGTTSIWGGRCIPMEKSDFRERRELGRAGWPVSYDEVARFYPRALDFLEAGACEYTAGKALPGEASDLAPVSRKTGLVLDELERFSPPTNLGTRYRKDLETTPNIRVLVNATCTEIMTDSSGDKAEGLSLRAGDKSLTVKARKTVIAAGGIETPRLLLCSRRVRSNGLGNNSDQVGRNYMTHIVGDLGHISFSSAPDTLRIDYEKSHDDVWCRRLLLLDEKTRLDNGLHNFVLRPTIPAIHDPVHGSAILSAAFFAKRFLIPEYARRLSSMPAGETTTEWPLVAHAKNLVLGTPAFISFASFWARKRLIPRRRLPSLFLPSASGTYPLEFTVEELPNPDSRIKLIRETDPNGMNRLSVSWDVPTEFPAQLLKIYKLVAREAQAGGLGSVILTDKEEEQVLERCYAQGGHHMGTARMSSAASNGVVDPDLQVWGTRGLYVLGSAVFPTCGYANPTLTIVALALRLADHLAEATVKSTGRQYSQIVKSVEKVH
jgi:choline dehydrogenase-like flavoprotein